VTLSLDAIIKTSSTYLKYAGNYKEFNTLSSSMTMSEMMGKGGTYRYAKSLFINNPIKIMKCQCKDKFDH